MFRQSRPPAPAGPIAAATAAGTNAPAGAAAAAGARAGGGDAPGGDGIAATVVGAGPATTGINTAINAGISRSSKNKQAAVKPRRGTLPAVSWSMAWLSGKGNSNGGDGVGKINNSGKRGRKGSRTGSFRDASLSSNEHGILDFRLISRWSFFTQLLREPQERKKTSIGTLYVKVVEGRGLLASDLNGRSDPYVKLCLTGRYLSHGQEWSEELRIERQTKIIKYSLDPVWDEEFTMPVRRSGAVLKVNVWDWDRSSPDDPLGHFEVTIGEELLCQQPIDMWYVLEAPRGGPASAQSAAERKLRRQEEQDRLADLARTGQAFEGGASPGGKYTDYAKEEEDELNSSPDSPLGMDESPHERREDGFSSSPSRRRRASTSISISSSASSSVSSRLPFGGKFRSGSVGSLDHSHTSEKEERACGACIERRRKLFGEVRLVLWYQFDEFAEACSHTWPEERANPDETAFSPNQLYRKGMLCYEMAKPYVNFLKETDSIFCWGRPRRSLLWMIALVVMLVVPALLIVVVNMALMRIVVSAYLKRRSRGARFGSGGGSSTEPQGAVAAAATVPAAVQPSLDQRPADVGLSPQVSASAGAVAAVAAAAAAGAPAASAANTSNDDSNDSIRSRPSSFGAVDESPELTAVTVPASPNGVRSQSLSFTPAAFASTSWRSPVRSPTFLDRYRRGSDGGNGVARAGLGDFVEGVAGDLGADSSRSMVPSNRSHGMGLNRLLSRSRPAPGTRSRPSLVGHRQSESDPSVATAGMTTPRRGVRASSSAPSRDAPWASDAHALNAHAGAVATHAVSPALSSSSAAALAAPGGQTSREDNPGQAAAGGFARKKRFQQGSNQIKKLLHKTRDPELQELYTRLGSTKKVPLVMNEVGKRLLSKSGPAMQRGFEKMGITLIQVRHRFNPPHVKALALALTALSLHTLLQLWLYLSGRFNLYFALLVVGQFTNKLYKRWGRAFVLALKEARRSHLTRQALSHTMSEWPSATTGDEEPSSPCAESASKVPRNPFRFDTANPPAFAPPGTTPASEPHPSPLDKNASRRTSVTSMFVRSPVTGHRRGSSISESVGGMAATTGGGEGAAGGGGGRGGGGVGEREGEGEVGGDPNKSSAAGGGVENGLSTPRGGRKAGGPWPSATPRFMSPPRFRQKASGKSGSGTTTTTTTRTSDAGATRASSSLRGGAGSSVGGGGGPRRWNAPWKKKSTFNGNDKCDDNGGMNGTGHSLGSASIGENSPTREGGASGGGGVGGGEKQGDGGQEGDRFSAPPALLPRLRSSGGKRPGGGKIAARRKIRWGRVLGSSLALTCAVAAIAALVMAPLPTRDGAESSSPLGGLWQGFVVPAWGLGVHLAGQGGGEAVAGREAWRQAGTKAASAWRAGWERFQVGVGAGGERGPSDFDDDDQDGRESDDDDTARSRSRSREPQSGGAA